jgi:hypothetical protein
MTDTKPAPFIVLDCKKGRIRFTKRTLEALTYPNYVRILINPEKGMLGVQRCEEMSHEANRLSKLNTDLGYVEIYCSMLIAQLLRQHAWKQSGSYRINATACLDHITLLFPLDQAEEIVLAKSPFLAEDVNEV